MTRQFATKKDRRWVMKCDEPGCLTRFGPYRSQPDLEQFRALGWHIADKWGDVCPKCLSEGIQPRSDATPQPVDVPLPEVTA